MLPSCSNSRGMKPPWAREGLVGLGKGWAIGSLAWRRALAEEHAARALITGLPRTERMELREASWQANLAAGLAESRKLPSDLKTKPVKPAWKIDLALQVRRQSKASISWLVENLDFGSPATVRVYRLHPRRVKN